MVEKGKNERWASIRLQRGWYRKVHPLPSQPLPPLPTMVSESSSATLAAAATMTPSLSSKPLARLSATIREATGGSTSLEEDDGEWEEVEEELTLAVPTFYPLPAFLVWPNLPMLVFWLLNSWLVKSATALLAWQLSNEPISQGGWYTLLAVAVLITVAAVLIITLCSARSCEK